MKSVIFLSSLHIAPLDVELIHIVRPRRNFSYMYLFRYVNSDAVVYRVDVTILLHKILA